MHVSVLLAHPDSRSFNHAIAATAVERLQRNGHHISFHDLYAERFDPLLPTPEIPSEAPLPSCIEMHCAEIRTADGFSFFAWPEAIIRITRRAA